MNEKKLIKKQLLKNMLYNLIAFTFIFTLFGMVIYNQVKKSIYSDVYRELLTHVPINNIETNFIRGVTPQGNAIIKVEKINPNNLNIFKRTNPPVFTNAMEIEILKNPRIIFIKRDKNGKIASETIGSLYNDFLTKSNFDTKNINRIYDLKLNNQYYYKGITYETKNINNEKGYVQLLINVNAETNIMNNLFKILIVGTGITIIFSIAISYVLSKKSLIPVIDSWEKQKEFIQNASHELRTPLTIIQAKQEMLLKSPDEKIIDKSEEISLTLKEVKRLSKLTTDLNILARADGTEETINKQITNIDELIKEVIKPYIEFANIQEKKINLNLQFNNSISIDREKIHQLMIILFDNAIKYTAEKDEIEICTYNKDNKCVIEVKDTGIGISEEGLSQVFDRFYREDKARTREKGGTGLGLSIAKWIVEIHKGTIKALHNGEKGTIMYIKLPIK